MRGILLIFVAHMCYFVIKHCFIAFYFSILIFSKTLLNCVFIDVNVEYIPEYFKGTPVSDAALRISKAVFHFKSEEGFQ